MPIPTPSPTGIDHNPDVALFAEQVAWFAEHLSPKSELAMAGWLIEAIRGAAREDEVRYQDLFRSVVRAFRWESSSQVQAEAAVIRVLLETDPTIAVRRYRLREEVGREVDWARTYVDSLGRNPSRYWCAQRAFKSDVDLLGAMMGLARLWRNGLRGASPERYAHRIEGLNGAIKVRRRRQLPSHPLTHRHLEKVSALGLLSTRELSPLYAVLGRQLKLPPHAKRRRIVEDAFMGAFGVELEGSHHSSKLNLLLELSARLSIARAAEHLGWHVEATSERNQGAIHLQGPAHCPITCEIGKAAPKGGDAYRSLRYLAGMDIEQGAQDSQPDIVLTFRGPGGAICAMGDAKRNGSGDGKGYFRDSLRAAVYYQAAYAHALGLQFHETGPTGPVSPAFTLFFRQGTRLPPEVKACLLGETGGTLPSLLALNLKDHFGVNPGLPWRSPTLVAWFKHLSQGAAARVGASGSLLVDGGMEAHAP